MKMRYTFLNQGFFDPKVRYDFLFVGLPMCSLPNLSGVELASSHIRILSQRYANNEPPIYPLKIYNPNEGYILHEAKIADFGDINDDLRKLKLSIDKIPMKNIVPIFVGGDHSVTLPILQSIGQNSDFVTVIHFDAHSDYLDDFDYIPHGSVMREVKKLDKIKKIVHIGLRGNLNTGPGIEQSKTEGNMIFTNIDVNYDIDYVQKIISSINCENVYISIDIDFFDPSIAPATNNPEHDGILYAKTLVLLKAICSNFKVNGVDIVEYNPKYDIANITGLLVTSLIMELMSYIKYKGMCIK